MEVKASDECSDVRDALYRFCQAMTDWEHDNQTIRGSTSAALDATMLRSQLNKLSLLFDQHCIYEITPARGSWITFPTQYTPEPKIISITFNDDGDAFVRTEEACTGVQGVMIYHLKRVHHIWKIVDERKSISPYTNTVDDWFL